MKSLRFLDQEGAVSQALESLDGGWREVAPAVVDILARAEDVEMAIEKGLPAAEAVQDLGDGEFARFDGVGEFIEIERAVGSAISRDKGIDVEVCYIESRA
jgi:hypothetical protein